MKYTFLGRTGLRVSRLCLGGSIQMKRPRSVLWMKRSIAAFHKCRCVRHNNSKNHTNIVGMVSLEETLLYELYS